jgi:putative tryptophan/tyrosine transport system substrate-binding protein
MKRRHFVTLIGGTAVGLPVCAFAQPRPPLIAFLGSTSADGPRDQAFRKGLAEHGFIADRNVRIVYFEANGRYEHLSSLALDVRHHNPAVVFASGNPAALAAKAANFESPVVFAIGGDPIWLNLVGSLNRPSGNITGITFYNGALIGKRLGVLHELVPPNALIAVPAHPGSPGYREQLDELRAAAVRLGRRVEHFDIHTVADFDDALAAIAERRAGGLLHIPDPFFNLHRGRLIDFVAGNRLPSVFPGREYVEGGASVAYGADIFDAFNQAGRYVGRVLNGEKPSELPVMQPTKFELILNLKAAKEQGMTFSPTLLALADEVVE